MSKAIEETIKVRYASEARRIFNQLALEYPSKGAFHHEIGEGTLHYKDPANGNTYIVHVKGTVNDLAVKR